MNATELTELEKLKSKLFDINNNIKKTKEDKRAEKTEIVANFIKNSYHIYSIRSDEKEEVWCYDEGIYIPNGKTFVAEECRRIFGKGYSKTEVNQILNKIIVDTYIDSNIFFSNNIIDEVVVENGILNIFTGKLSEFDEEKIFFQKIPVKYVSGVDCPTIKKHFKTVLKNLEDTEIIQEVFGFLLLKNYKIEKAIMMNGSGRNGKGKSLELMETFLCAKNCSSLSLQSISKIGNFEMSELFGKFANLCGDLSQTALKETGNFKQLTGRDMITATRKFLPPIYFRNYAKMIFSCNEMPMVYDTSVGFWERWVYLDFPYTFLPEAEINEIPIEERSMYKVQDVDIVNRLTTPEELSGLLNWALEGLSRLLKNKRFSETKTTKQIKKLWIRRSGSFNAFCQDRLDECIESEVTKEELKREYAGYCKKHDIKPMNDKIIKNILETTFCVSDGRRYNDENRQVRVWVGVKLKKIPLDFEVQEIFTRETNPTRQETVKFQLPS